MSDGNHQHSPVCTTILNTADKTDHFRGRGDGIEIISLPFVFSLDGRRLLWCAYEFVGREEGKKLLWGKSCTIAVVLLWRRLGVKFLEVSAASDWGMGCGRDESLPMLHTDTYVHRWMLLYRTSVIRFFPSPFLTKQGFVTG